MVETEQPVAERRSARLEALVWAGLLLGMALAPRLLSPDPRGYGTHEQLFLPGCTLRVLTTLPCPLCGLTTAFAHMSRGEVTRAARSHPAGPLLYTLAALGGAYCLVWAIAGRHPLRGRGYALLQPRAIVPALLALWLLALLARFVRD